MAPDDMSSKRRKVDMMPQTAIGINNLSSDELVLIAQYLPKTSRALLAVAMTAPSSSFRERGWDCEPSATIKTIVASVKACEVPPSLFEQLYDSLLSEQYEEGWWAEASEDKRQRTRDKYMSEIGLPLKKQLAKYYNDVGWDALDIIDLDKSLASRLNDDDLGALLVCIDAKHHAKQVNLSYCDNIVGHGLEPIRLSTTLEKLDIDGVPEWAARYSSYDIEKCFRKKSSLSEEFVLPILRDIIGADGGSFARLRLPIECIKDGRFPSDELQGFLDEHEQHVLGTARICYFGFSDGREQFLESITDDFSDKELYCSCLDFYLCSTCNRMVCYQCDDMETCVGCAANTYSCDDCRERYDCDYLESKRYILEDIPERLVYRCDCDVWCYKCRNANCDACKDFEDYSGYCQHCQELIYRKMSAKVHAQQADMVSLMEENEAQKGEVDAQKEAINLKQAEIDSLQDVIERLHHHVEQLTT